MLSYLVGLWMAAAVGQAPAEASWLESVPADIPVVVRCRALEDVKGELLAMLKAMSPTAGGDVRDEIDDALKELEETFVKGAGKSPFFVLLRPPDPAQPEFPAWGVIAKTNDPSAAIKALAQEGGAKPKSLDGYESFVAGNGATLYAARGTGWVAYGSEEAMIKAIHKPRSSLAGALSPEGRARFLAGDVGLYVNLAAVQKQYCDLIEQSKEAIKDQLGEAMDAGAGKAMNARTANLVFDALATALKVGDRLTLSLDFGADGLTIAGLAAVKGDSPAAQGLARAGTGTGQLLARLPAGNMFYVYGGDALGYPGGLPRSSAGPAPRSRAAMAVKKAEDDRTRVLDGRLVAALSVVPMNYTGLADLEDPAAAVAASRELVRARLALLRDGTRVALDAVTHGGFRLDNVRTEVDQERMAKAFRPVIPQGPLIMQKITGGKDFTTHMGTDGKLFFEATNVSDDQVKAQIDAVNNGAGSLGSLAAWKALRPRLPERATALVVLDTQEAIKALLAMIGPVTNRPDLKPPADMPRVPALMGTSLIVSPAGYDFRLVVPSDVGPVLEKGLAPLD
jgi:hypothetical protein